jgi:serine/threonine protein kinase
MELRNYGSLDTCIRNNNIFPINILRNITRFLETVHREINSKHILATCDESGKISYRLIGLKHCMNLNKIKGKFYSFVGEYMAPETNPEVSDTFALDVWSVGVTLYELALGVSFHKGEVNLKLRVREELNPVFPSNVSVD